MIKTRLEGKKIYRIQFELTKRSVEEIEELMEITEVTTRKDIFNYALTLLEWAIKEKQRGRIIASVDEKKNKYKELSMPILSKGARSKIKLVA